MDLGPIHPELKKAADSILNDMFPPVRIVSGYRSAEEQEKIYAIGRNGDTRSIVSNAVPWKSYHNYGLALDFCFVGSDPYPKDDYYWNQFGMLVQKNGLKWGGDFKFQDKPHVQLDVQLTYNEAKEKWMALGPDDFFKWIDKLRGV